MRRFPHRMPNRRIGKAQTGEDMKEYSSNKGHEMDAITYAEMALGELNCADPVALANAVPRAQVYATVSQTYALLSLRRQT